MCRATAHPSGLARLARITRCPDCKGELLPACRVLTPAGRLKSGVLFCPACGGVKGTVRNFKYDFVHFDAQAAGERLRRSGIEAPPSVLPYEVAEEVVAFDDPRLTLRGAWESWDGRYRLSHGAAGDELAFAGEFLDVSARLLKHPWSGRARFLVDGVPAGEVDLYQPKWSTVTWFPIAGDLAPGPHEVRIVPTGGKHPEAAGSQVLFHELIVTRPGYAGAASPAKETNRVLPVFPAVVELMKQAPADGLILDCGGGDRALGDPRYINVDYQQYQLPAVYGDAMKLPFESGVFDLVFSQALLEHVANPFAAAAEMARVTRPGGVLWAGMAFLQPVHAVPSHYFNATAWGIEELFKQLEIEEVSWFGELSFTIEWLLKESGAAGRMEAGEYAALIERLKSLDALVPYEALRAVASGVAVRAHKPA